MSEGSNATSAEAQFREAVEALRHAEFMLVKLNRHQPGNVSMGLTAVANQLWLARAGLLALGVSIAPGEMVNAEIERDALVAAIRLRNPSASAAVVDIAASIAAKRKVTVEERQDVEP